MKKNAVKGIDILSEPFMLIASAIVMAKQDSIIAKKVSRVSNWWKTEFENKYKIINVLKNIIAEPS